MHAYNSDFVCVCVCMSICVYMCCMNPECQQFIQWGYDENHPQRSRAVLGQCLQESRCSTQSSALGSCKSEKGRYHDQGQSIRSPLSTVRHKAWRDPILDRVNSEKIRNNRWHMWENIATRTQWDAILKTQRKIDPWRNQRKSNKMVWDS